MLSNCQSSTLEPFKGRNQPILHKYPAKTQLGIFIDNDGAYSNTHTIIPTLRGQILHVHVGWRKGITICRVQLGDLLCQLMHSNLALY